METPQKARISAGQLFSMFFVSRAVIMITLNSQLLGGENMLDNLISTAVSFVLEFVLVIPVFLLYRRRPTLNALDYSDYLLGKAGIAVVLLYALYFLMVSVYYMSFFQLFLSNVIDPKTPLWLVAVCVLVVAVYGAFKGIEAIARASGFILVIVIAGLLFIIVTLFPQMDPLNFRPFLYDGPQQALSGITVAVGRSTCLVAMALLLPEVKGKKKLNFTLWNAGVYLLLTLMLYVIIGTMGEFANNLLFPVYTASSIANAGVFRRFDAIFLGVWMTGLFIRIAMDLFLIARCIKKIAGDRAARVGIVLAAAAVMALSLVVTGSAQLQKIFYDPVFLLAATLFMVLTVPVFLLLLDLAKGVQIKRKEAGR